MPQLPRGPKKVYGVGQQGASHAFLELYNQVMDRAHSLGAPTGPLAHGPGDDIAPGLMLDARATEAFRTAINTWAAVGGDTPFQPPLPLPPGQRSELARRLALLTSQRSEVTSLPGREPVAGDRRQLPFARPVTEGQSARDRFAKYLLDVSQPASPPRAANKFQPQDLPMPSLSTTRKSGGIGSRGGVVIGTTRSGKPIYQADHHSYEKTHQAQGQAGSSHEEDEVVHHEVRSAHRGWSRDDHLDAADAHSRFAGGVGRGNPLRAQSHVASQGHAMASMTVDRQMSPGKAEKSRGRAVEVLRRALARG